MVLDSRLTAYHTRFSGPLDLELNLLPLFLKTVQNESLQRTAKAEGLQPDVLEERLQALEQTLGQELFEWAHHPLRLTQAGKQLKKWTESLFGIPQLFELSQLEQESGCLSIGCMESSASHWIVSTMERLKKTCPQLSYAFYFGDSQDIYELLRQGRIDIGLALLPPNQAEFHVLRVPAQEAWGLLVRKDDLLAPAEYIFPEQLEYLPLIVPRQQEIWEGIREHLELLPHRCHIISTYNQLSSAALLTDCGLGYTVCEHSAFAASNPENTCFIPFASYCTTGHGLLWHRERVLSAPAALFTAIFRHSVSW